MNKHRILILNGPGLNDLSAYQEYSYEKLSLEKIEQECVALCLAETLNLEFRQTNNHDQMFQWIIKDSDNLDGLIINPLGYSQAENIELEMYQSSIQKITDMKKPVIEVHITNIFNQGSGLTRPFQIPNGEMGFICGLNYHGYLLAIRSIAYQLRSR